MEHDKQHIINQTITFVRQRLEGEGSGHDWWHIHRVWKNALYIGTQEKANLFVVQLAALLHDIADWKLHDGNEEIGPAMARTFLIKENVDNATIHHICDIIGTLSFKGASTPSIMKTLEGMVVQDADRLDAIGAIGIARTFAYGGYKQRELYNPNIKPNVHQTKDEYKKNTAPTINHFYEKLLLLKDLMNTATAQKMAHERHAFMQLYLDTFFTEVGEINI